MKVRTDLAEKMLIKMLLFFFVFILCQISLAEAVVNATTDDAEAVVNATADDAKAVVNATTDDAVLQPCETKCGCEEMYIYDAVNDTCLIDFKKVMKKVVVIYGKNNVESLADDEMAKSIYIEGEKLFKGIMISVILFMTCASVCVVSACIYCCRINYTDRTLKKNVKVLAKRLKRDYSSSKMAAKRAPLPAIRESCSVLVEPAGVMVV